MSIAEKLILNGLRSWNLEPQHLRTMEAWGGPTEYVVGVIINGEAIQVCEGAYEVAPRIIKEYSRRMLHRMLGLGESIRKIVVELGLGENKENIYYIKAQIKEYSYRVKANSLQQAKDMLLEQYKSGKGSKTWV